MGKKRKIFIGISMTLFALGFALYALIHFINSSEINILDSKPEMQLIAEDFITYFKLHKNDNDSPYLEKVIGVEGTIREINNLNNRHTILLKGGEDESSSIICDMQTNQIQNIKKLKLGDTILLKGIYKGFLKDAILLNCVLTNKETND